MHKGNEIRRRSDGSIDTGYYMEIGRTCRSQAFHKVCSAIGAFLSTPKSTSGQASSVAERGSATPSGDWSGFIRQAWQDWNTGSRNMNRC